MSDIEFSTSDGCPNAANGKASTITTVKESASARALAIETFGLPANQARHIAPRITRTLELGSFHDGPFLPDDNVFFMSLPIRETVTRLLPDRRGPAGHGAAAACPVASWSTLWDKWVK